MFSDRSGPLLSDVTRALSWDDANRLANVKVTKNGATLSVDYAYGPDGSRVKKSTRTATTLYPDAGVEIDPAKATVTRYPHTDIKLETTAAGVTTKSFQHRDHLASVRLVTNASGQLEQAESTPHRDKDKFRLYARQGRRQQLAYLLFVKSLNLLAG